MARIKREKRYSSGTLRPGAEGYGRMNKRREEPEVTNGCLIFLSVPILIFIATLFT